MISEFVYRDHPIPSLSHLSSSNYPTLAFSNLKNICRGVCTIKSVASNDESSSGVGCKKKFQTIKEMKILSSREANLRPINHKYQHDHTKVRGREMMDVPKQPLGPDPNGCAGPEKGSKRSFPLASVFSQRSGMKSRIVAASQAPNLLRFSSPWGVRAFSSTGRGGRT
jgi:hypothetical protein